MLSDLSQNNTLKLKFLESDLGITAFIFIFIGSKLMIHAT